MGEGKSYVTGVAAPLPLPTPFPPPRIVELGTSEVDVLKRDILVDGSRIGVVDGNGTGVTIELLDGDGDGDGTTTGGGVGVTTGLILTVVKGELRIPPGSEVDAPPLTGKPAASIQV